MPVLALAAATVAGALAAAPAGDPTPTRAPAGALVAAHAGDPTAQPAYESRELAGEPPLPARSRLARRRLALGGGPRGDWRFAAQRSRSGRRIQVNFFGSGRARSKLLVAGCTNGRRCVGEQIVRALAYDCPPTDAEFWLMPTLRPEGADLDARAGEPGAAALRQSVADLRPTLTVTYRTGPRAAVRAAGAGLAPARRYARLAGIPLGAPLRDGLAAWTQRALGHAAAITIELPPARLALLEARRHAYALQRIAGTRFARPVAAHSSLDGRLSVLLSEEWHAPKGPITGVDGEVLALATFPLRHAQAAPGCLSASIRRRIGRDDALILVFERGGAGPDVREQPRHFRLDRHARAMSRCFGDFAIRFAAAGRELEVRVAVGGAARAYRLGDAQDVLDSLRARP